MIGSGDIASVLSSEFDKDQEEKVLEPLNSLSVARLRTLKYFSQQRAVNIVKHREEHGEFTTLSDVLAVPGFGVLGIKRIAKAILNNETTDRKNTAFAGAVKAVRSSICHPRAPADKCQVR